MLQIVVRTEDGERHVRVSAGELAGLVRRIGGPDDHFLVLQRIPDLPASFAQVWHDAGGDYTVEYRDGGPDRHFGATTDDPGAVLAALTGWARQDDGWEAGLTWTPADVPPEPEVPPLDLGDADRTELEQRLKEMLAAGYATRDRLAEVAADYLVTGERRPVSAAQARALADRLWLERVEEQTGWRGETDPERLTGAFTALDDAGVTAREHFACCRSCGDAEIGGAAAPDARGFVYFTYPSAESAAADGVLTLYYGGFDDSPETTAAVGREVVAALAAAGLRTAWDGDPGRAIDVTGLDWRRRLVG
ncbi:DUF6891 domain-containing protein [Streptomyces sp. MAR4 CNX-425]|uniref:DUF6891 domain-containing protein n=1 Tax=Streptomyces sp. MAR4 CNX-425 TaxID=3406343 RepID=UPI003B5093F9